jgi:hypothetical protein
MRIIRFVLNTSTLRHLGETTGKDGWTDEGWIAKGKNYENEILNLIQFCGAESGHDIKNLQLDLVSKLRKESRKNKPPLTGRVERLAEKKNHLS